MTIRIYLEEGKRRVFACAADWPGWCRSSKEESGAIEILLSYAPRYAYVAEASGVVFDSRDVGAHSVRILERVAGGATTDFGAPEKAVSLDERAMSHDERARHVALMQGAWRVFDEVVDTAPPALTKGPRGGGRDRDAIAGHVLGAEVAYARKLGVRTKQPLWEDREAVLGLREAITSSVTTARGAGPLVDKGWLVRYAVRRITWHVLDHAWEIEDRSP